MSTKKILLVAATLQEVESIALALDCSPSAVVESGRPFQLYRGERVDCLITGVGQFFTTLALTTTLIHNNYGAAVQAGIGGSFSGDYPIGSVVSVVEDAFADCGAETRDGFLDLFEMGLWNPEQSPFLKGMVLQQPSSIQEATKLPSVRGVTVNRTLSAESSIAWISEHFSPVTVSMEGAPFLYMCAHFGISCLQVRAISDRVGPRNKESWDIPAAIGALQEPVCECIEMILGSV